MNKIDNNYGHSVIAEIYDQVENYTDDVDLIKRVIKGNNLNILECFSGTGRISIPLAIDGHNVTGIDLSTSMIDRAILKVNKLDEKTKNRIKFINDDITKTNWGSDYDVIIIGCNALYELPNPEIQEETISLAHKALKEGGMLFIDSDDYKGNWSDERFLNEWLSFEGKCLNGDYGRVYMKHTNYDENTHILDYKRTLKVTHKDGKVNTLSYNGQKHPLTKDEIESWLVKYNFNIENIYGDWDQSPFTKDSRRAIFIATK